MLKPRQSRVFLVDDIDSIAARAKQSLDPESTNYKFVVTLLRATAYAECHELTARQRDCFHMRYAQHKKVREIAAELDIDASTVSRHILLARKRVNNYAKYSMFAFKQTI